MTYATLNKNAIGYEWLEDLLHSKRVPLVSNDLLAPQELAGLSEEVSYVVAINRLTPEQRVALIEHCAEQNEFSIREVQALFERIGGCPIAADALTITAQAGK